MDLRPIEELEHLLQEEETSTPLERFLSDGPFLVYNTRSTVLITHSGLPEYPWAYALSTSAYIRKHP